MASEKLNPLAMGYAAAIVSAAIMLLLSIANALGIYTNAAMQMNEMHMFYSFGIVGTITGMIEAAVISFVFLYALAWVYNKFA